MQPVLRKLYFLYHELQRGKNAYSYSLDVAEFEKQIDLFVHLKSSADTKLIPEVTFDDGHISNFEFALPVLDSRDMKAHFFITAGWTGQKPDYMGWPELRALQEAGQLIGAHGWSHTLLTHCSGTDLQAELSRPKLALEDKLGASIVTMSLPGGRYNRRVLAACEEAGYTQIFTSIPRSEPVPCGCLIGRLNVRADMELDWIASLLDPGSNVLAGLKTRYQIKAAAKRLLGDSIYEKVWAMVNKKEPGAEAEGASDQ